MGQDDAGRGAGTVGCELDVVGCDVGAGCCIGEEDGVGAEGAVCPEEEAAVWVEDCVCTDEGDCGVVPLDDGVLLGVGELACGAEAVWVCCTCSMRCACCACCSCIADEVPLSFLDATTTAPVATAAATTYFSSSAARPGKKRNILVSMFTDW